MERDYTTYLIEKARSKHTARLLEYLLEIHDAFVQGVTAHEATEWLELPPGRAAERLDTMNLNPQNTLAPRHRQEFEWALRDKDIKLDTHTVDTLCEIIKTFLLERDEDGYQQGRADALY